jgi:putative transposase
LAESTRVDIRHEKRDKSRRDGRKSYKEKLRTTPEQERQLDVVLWRCRTLYNVALEQRKTAWERCQSSVKRFAQEAELANIRAEFPAYAAIHSHVLQDVLARLDKAYQAFCRRVQAREKPGYPRFQGRNRYHSFTYKEYGNGARLDNGYLVLSKIGRIAVHWSRPIEGTIRTVTISKEADGWYVSFSCVDVPVQSLAKTGRETGMDVGLKVFLVAADGDVVENPRHYRHAEHELKKAQRRVSRRKKGSKRRKKAAKVLAKRHQKVRRQRHDFHHKTALALVRAYDTIYLEDLEIANLSHRPAPVPDGQGGYLHNGASAKAGQNKSIQDALLVQFPYDPHFQGRMRREASGSRATSVHVPGLQRLRGTGREESLRSDPCLSLLWAHPGSRRERGQKHSRGRAGPSGSPSSGWGDEPRNRHPLGRAEWQLTLHCPCKQGHEEGWWTASAACSGNLAWLSLLDPQSLLDDGKAIDADQDESIIARV